MAGFLVKLLDESMAILFIARMMLVHAINYSEDVYAFEHFWFAQTLIIIIKLNLHKQGITHS